LKKNWILVLAGMALYIGAFFLVAARDANPSRGTTGYPGWFCAFITLSDPWEHDALKSIREGPVEFFSMLFSGWINPLFLVTLLVSLLRPKGRLAFALRIVLLLMFPACWIVFYKLSLYPREGYFVWMLGMLLVTFAAPGARSSRQAPKSELTIDNRVGIT
jgi:hypothetical protein